MYLFKQPNNIRTEIKLHSSFLEIIYTIILIFSLPSLYQIYKHFGIIISIILFIIVLSIIISKKFKKETTINLIILFSISCCFFWGIYNAIKLLINTQTSIDILISNIAFCFLIFICPSILILLLNMWKKRISSNNVQLALNILIFILIILCLAFTTFNSIWLR